MKSLTSLSTVAVLFFASFVPAHAAVIYNTYNGNDDGTASNIHSGNGKALAFTMPATLLPGGTTSYDLNSVQMRFSGSASSTDMTVSLYSNDGSNTPGTLLGTLTPSSSFTLTGSVATYTFNATSLTLSASTTYWVAMTASVASGIYWHTSSPLPSPLSSVGVTDGGGVYGGGSPDTWTSTSGVRNSLTVNATAVPEPGTCVLFATGALCVILRSRKARRW